MTAIDDALLAGRTVRQPEGVELVFPAEVHVRIIAETGVLDVEELRRAVRVFRVTSPLAASRLSAGGRYASYGVSVRVESRSEWDALEQAVKAVRGVRFVL
jgi:putative lipoic acid-binding regulatory protein